MGLTVELCMNPNVIRTLYDDEFVQERYEQSGYYGWIDKEDLFYVAGKDDGEFKCCAMCIIRSMWDIEVHLCIPKASRSLAFEFCELLIAWLFVHFPCNRITTTVVGVFPQVANFAKRLGFTYEGAMRGACHRDDGFVDLWVYSLLRGEPYGRR